MHRDQRLVNIMYVLLVLQHSSAYSVFGILASRWSQSVLQQPARIQSMWPDEKLKYYWPWREDGFSHHQHQDSHGLALNAQCLQGNRNRCSFYLLFTSRLLGLWGHLLQNLVQVARLGAHQNNHPAHQKFRTTIQLMNWDRNNKWLHQWK